MDSGLDQANQAPCCSIPKTGGEDGYGMSDAVAICPGGCRAAWQITPRMRGRPPVPCQSQQEDLMGNRRPHQAVRLMPLPRLRNRHAWHCKSHVTSESYGTYSAFGCGGPQPALLAPRFCPYRLDTKCPVLATKQTFSRPALYVR